MKIGVINIHLVVGNREEGVINIHLVGRNREGGVINIHLVGGNREEGVININLVGGVKDMGHKYPFGGREGSPISIWWVEIGRGVIKWR